MNKDVIIGVLKKYPIATVAFIVFFALVISLLLRGDQSLELEGQEVELNSELSVLDANSKNAIGLGAHADAMDAYLEQIQAKLFDAEQRAVNTNFFYNLESIADIRMESVSGPGGADEANAKGGPNELKLYDHLVYNISIMAEYEEIIRFLDEVTRVDAFVRISDLQMTQSQGAASEYGYLARVRLVILAKKGS